MGSDGSLGAETGLGNIIWLDLQFLAYFLDRNHKVREEQSWWHFSAFSRFYLIGTCASVKFVRPGRMGLLVKAQMTQVH